MVRLILRYLSQGLLVLAPLLTPVIVPAFHLQRFYKLVFGTDEPLTDEVKATLTCVFLVCVFAIDVYDLYLPRRTLRSFRGRYLKAQIAEWRSKLHEDVRVNVMTARRKWYLGWLVRRFEWSANDGFKPGRHRDTGVRFLEWQGVCGRALRGEEVIFEDLRREPDFLSGLKWHERWLYCNRFHLSHRQLKRTRDVRAILSVPMYRQTHPEPNVTWKAAGVINLDAVTPEGADWLAANARRLEEYLLEGGTAIAEID